MKRLTKKRTYNEKEHVSISGEEGEMKCGNFCTSCGEADCEDIKRALFRLAEYEDLEQRCIYETTFGLRQLIEKWNEFYGDIQELYEYRKLKEQNKLLILPCAVGDTVYVLAECENIPTQLDGTLYRENGEPGTATGYYCPYEDNCPFDDEDFEDCEKYKKKTAVFEDTVCFIACDEMGVNIVTKNCTVHSQIGEYIFLTKEQAESALKEREGKE